MSTNGYRRSSWSQCRACRLSTRRQRLGPRLLHDLNLCGLLRPMPRLALMAGGGGTGRDSSARTARHTDGMTGIQRDGRLQGLFIFSLTIPNPLAAVEMNAADPAPGIGKICATLFRYVHRHGSKPKTPVTRQCSEAAVTLMLRGFLGNNPVRPRTFENRPAAIQKTLHAIPAKPLATIRRCRSHDALEEEAHVSPEYLCRLFRRHLRPRPRSNAPAWPGWNVRVLARPHQFADPLSPIRVCFDRRFISQTSSTKVYGPVAARPIPGLNANPASHHPATLSSSTANPDLRQAGS